MILSDNGGDEILLGWTSGGFGFALKSPANGVDGTMASGKSAGVSGGDSVGALGGVSGGETT